MICSRLHRQALARDFSPAQQACLSSATMVAFMIASIMPRPIGSIVRASMVSIIRTGSIVRAAGNNNPRTVCVWRTINIGRIIGRIGRRRVDRHRPGYAYAYSHGNTTRPTVLGQKTCCHRKQYRNDD
jgi:hypothetical protein